MSSGLHLKDLKFQMKSFCLVALFVVGVYSHGRIMEPPGRSSAWRFGFDTPINYNDNELFCGGFDRQYDLNGGKCGICGDPWDLPAPRENEDGGLYGTKTITRNYTQGQLIDVDIEVTSQHDGFFEFKLCPVQEGVESTQECLDQYPLEIVPLGKTRFHFNPNPAEGRFLFKLRLPEGLTCARCVLQWHWTTGNRWGVCDEGDKVYQGMGCGPQEVFRGCADVSIQ